MLFRLCGGGGLFPVGGGLFARPVGGGRLSLRMSLLSEALAGGAGGGGGRTRLEGETTFKRNSVLITALLFLFPPTWPSVKRVVNKL